MRNAKTTIYGNSTKVYTCFRNAWCVMRRAHMNDRAIVRKLEIPGQFPKKFSSDGVLYGKKKPATDVHWSSESTDGISLSLVLIFKQDDDAYQIIYRR